MFLKKQNTRNNEKQKQNTENYFKNGTNCKNCKNYMKKEQQLHKNKAEYAVTRKHSKKRRFFSKLYKII